MNFTLLGLPFDKTQTLRKGASKAPDMIRNIFPKLETNISGVNLAECFFEDMGNITADSMEELEKKISQVLPSKNFPVILGGEHSISLPCIKSLKPETIVWIDAHPDCEDSFAHNGVARKLTELGFKVILFGARTFSKKETQFIEEKKIKLATLEDLKNLQGKIYLSIDFDALDTSILKAVGNPEPSGLLFDQVVEAVSALSKNLIAVDFVEFTPLGIESIDEIEALTAGKLINACLAEIVKANIHP